MPSLRRLLLLLGGCVVLGVGVGLLLTADLGSDGYSTLIQGTALALDVPFGVANLGVGLLFVLVAAARRVRPGLGTVVQVVVVGFVVSAVLAVFPTASSSVLVKALLLVGALPVLAVGIAAYLGSRTGAGPTEAMGLAWDPPIPFAVSYSLVQGGGALVGWLLGATIGVGTVAVIVALGPAVALASRLLGLEVPQRDVPA